MTYKKNKSIKYQNLDVNGCKIIFSKNIHEPKGSIHIGEVDKEIPFTPKRYFIVSDVPKDEVRGQHAHKMCHQYLICINGTVCAEIDDGYKKSKILLNEPSFGLYMPPKIWGKQYSFSKDAKLLVLASHFYEESDYINSYDQFIREIGN